jgi:hypothetical protein
MPLKRMKALVYSLLIGISTWAGPVIAAGTTPLSLVQQFDSTGAPLAGGLLYFFVAGTVATPQNAFQDFGLTAPLSNPVTLDPTGRVPQHWLADGLIHIRLTDSAGLVYVDTTMQVLGPSSGGGGGGGTVDPTALISTGDLKFKYATGPLPGFVRCNGLTIGNAVSGATERANADTQALFIFLYGVDPNLVVSGGRTGNALTDYNANKTITTPDMRGRVVAGLDDMGNTAAGRLTAFTGFSATVLGNANGTEARAITLGQLPTGITSAGTVTVTSVSAHNYLFGGSNVLFSGGGISFVAQSPNTGDVVSSGSNTLTSNNTSGQLTPIVQPTMLATFYVKL